MTIGAGNGGSERGMLRGVKRTPNVPPRNKLTGRWRLSERRRRRNQPASKRARTVVQPRRGKSDGRRDSRRSAAKKKKKNGKATICQQIHA